MNEFFDWEENSSSSLFWVALGFLTVSLLSLVGFGLLLASWSLNVLADGWIYTKKKFTSYFGRSG